MSQPRFRALVLRAGFGTRLRPLTWWLAKPLLPIGAESVAGHTLSMLRRAGCEAAVINLHHRAEDLPGALGRDYRGLALEYSHEQPVQGTSGALYAPRDFLAESDGIVLVNGDSFCPWPVRKVLAHHRKRGADATLLLLPGEPKSVLGGGIAVDAVPPSVAEIDVFELEPAVEIQVMDEIQESTEALLMEGVRQLDEMNQIRSQLPSPHSSLAVPTPLAGKLRDLDRNQLDVFQLVLDHGQVQAVLDRFEGSDLDAAGALAHLLKKEFVVVP